VTHSGNARPWRTAEVKLDLASAGLLLLAEEVEELALQVDLQAAQSRPSSEDAQLPEDAHIKDMSTFEINAHLQIVPPVAFG